MRPYLTLLALHHGFECYRHALADVERTNKDEMENEPKRENIRESYQRKSQKAKMTKTPQNTLFRKTLFLKK